MRVEMRVWFPGETSTGEPWPNTGGQIDLPEVEAEKLIASGAAVAVDGPAVEADPVGEVKPARKKPTVKKSDAE